MSIANSIRAQIPPVHPEGYPFIGGFALASLILFWIWTPLGWIGTLLTIWPDRQQCADPAKRRPDPEQDQARKRKTADKRIALGVNRRNLRPDGISDGHRYH